MKSKLLLLLALAGLALAAPAAQAGSCNAPASWGSVRPSFERQVVALVNAHRRSIGLRALSVAAPLRRAARWKSRHMARYRYFEHADPSGRSPFARMRDCGYRAKRTMGENIAAGQRSPRAVVRAWLDSPGHRQNIENPAFTQIGIGAAYKRGSDYGWYWTQDFGG